jgi:hypothetical protein
MSWRVEIKVEGCTVPVQTFETAEEASELYTKMTDDGVSTSDIRVIEVKS